MEEDSLFSEEVEPPGSAAGPQGLEDPRDKVILSSGAYYRLNLHRGRKLSRKVPGRRRSAGVFSLVQHYMSGKIGVGNCAIALPMPISLRR